MSNRVATMANKTPSPPTEAADFSEKDFALPRPAASFDSHNHLAPPTPFSLGLALQQAGIMSQIDGSPVLRPESGTPPSATSTAPGSPRIRPVRQNSGTTTPRVRPPATTLNIPGMTSSKVSPDGKIAERDVGSKLVVIMVGLPARGKSYITKKIHRYLQWQQHNSQIFNVGNRRRTAAGVSITSPPTSPQHSPRNSLRTTSIAGVIDAPTQAAHILLNGIDPLEQQNELTKLPSADTMEQSADFFLPSNERASQIREQVALSTCDELLDFLLKKGGSVGILDATNSTIARRQILSKHIKDREPKLNILFIESVCKDPKLLEANMHLKLRGPDYKDKDPESSLRDFKKRIDAYESAYQPLGDYEEENHMQYIKMIDVGRKFINYRVQGFLANGIATYLSSFNLSPRQIWLTRHGQSHDNLLNRIGGNSHLTEDGRDFGTALYNLVTTKRQEWEEDQRKRAIGGDHPLMPGDQTPPYPDLFSDLEEKNFCVWTSMLHRSIETAKDFQDDENYDVKAWAPLKELDAGDFEGLTYEQIRDEHADEFAKRKADKLNYIYPGVGGEGYLHVIGRLREIIRELERIKDHVLIIGHRSVCRVLMAYFMDLPREDVAGLDIPLGMVVNIEPKPYGMECHAYKYNEETAEFDEVLDYNPRKQALDDGPECKPRPAHVTVHGHHSILGQAPVLTPATINGDSPGNGEVASYSQAPVNGHTSILDQALVLTPATTNGDTLVNREIPPYSQATVNGQPSVLTEASVNRQRPVNVDTANYNDKVMINGTMPISGNASTNCQTCGN